MLVTVNKSFYMMDTKGAKVDFYVICLFGNFKEILMFTWTAESISKNVVLWCVF